VASALERQNPAGDDCVYYIVSRGLIILTESHNIFADPVSLVMTILQIKRPIALGGFVGNINRQVDEVYRADILDV
jgi:hypothetical protein